MEIKQSTLDIISPLILTNISYEWERFYRLTYHSSYYLNVTARDVSSATTVKLRLQGYGLLTDIRPFGVLKNRVEATFLGL